MTGTERILVVDDDPDIADFIATVARGRGFDAKVLTDSARVLETYRSYRPALIVLDLMMPGTDGVQVLRNLAEERCSADIILFSGADARTLNTTARLSETHGLRVRQILRKPVDIEDLETALRQPKSSQPDVTPADVRDAIARREITAFFQPKVHLRGEGCWRVAGFEALARWQHPDNGLIGPDIFIPIAEEAELIDNLTDLIVEETLLQAGRLRSEGNDLKFAINLSAKMLSNEQLPDRLSGMLASHGFECEQLIIEITESAAMSDSVKGMENLARFRLKGMSLSMDDFGTGHSSLVQLHRMPFSELKIDRSFVQELDASEESRIIVRAINDLAHNLGLHACAEGVETRKALSFLRSIGCDQAQGYLISKPLSGENLSAFLRRHSESEWGETLAEAG